MKYAELLDEYIYNSGKSLQAISDECNNLGENLTVSYLSKLRNKKMPAPSYEKTIVLSKVLNIDPEILLAASIKDSTESDQEELKKALGKMYPEADPEEIFEKALILSLRYNVILDPPYEPTQEELDEHYKMVIDEIEEQNMIANLPILGTIAAGQSIDRIEHNEGYMPILKSVVNGYKAFWLRVKGESMSGDEIHDSDLVCVVKTTDVNPSDIAAVAINNDEATLKRVKVLDGKCILTPSNRSMEPMIYDAKDVNIIGKVVGFQRYYK